MFEIKDAQYNLQECANFKYFIQIPIIVQGIYHYIMCVSNNSLLASRINCDHNNLSA